MKKQKEKQIKEVLTMSEAMKYLNVSRSTLDRAARNGSIQKRTINGGRKVFFNREDIIKMLNQ